MSQRQISRSCSKATDLSIFGREKLTGNRSDKGDKLVQVITGPDGNGGTDEQDEDAEKVLLPLDQVVVLARARKDAILHDTDSREELQRD